MVSQSQLPLIRFSFSKPSRKRGFPFDKFPMKSTGWKEKNGPPCHTKFDLFSIVLGKSDETMPYRLDLGNSFGVVYIAVTYLVQELC